jgi:hypothetical protein
MWRWKSIDRSYHILGRVHEGKPLLNLVDNGELKRKKSTVNVQVYSMCLFIVLHWSSIYRDGLTF